MRGAEGLQRGRQVTLGLSIAPILLRASHRRAATRDAGVSLGQVVADRMRAKNRGYLANPLGVRFIGVVSFPISSP